MRIAQVAPLIESVPPEKYGGTERIVSYLTEELVRKGHAVTLFASGDSVTQARLIAGCRRALRMDETCKDVIAHHILMLEKLWQMSDEFDIIHNHLDYLPFSCLRRITTPAVTTLHGRLDLPDLVPLYQEFNDTPLISISNSQRKPLAAANWIGTVYHGLPADLYRMHMPTHSEDYLAFLGRVSPEKGLDRAIEIARRAGRPLRIAAKVDKVDHDYFREKIRPLISEADVEFLGEIKDAEKNDFIGNAHAVLFAIDWPEPFGIALIEAMACGTPVIAFRRGAVPEIVVEGITGYMADTVEQAAAAVEKVDRLDRTLIRRLFLERFTASRMADDYLAVYHRLHSPETLFEPRKSLVKN
ncbi:MAG: glycosyltransferase family 4 protein [Desulfobacteraceae bacterium]|nr:MAG: glycosyltransferase family 4 protein [Desulfobacteraceae bacterium]